jgi:hypothetical protein
MQCFITPNVVAPKLNVKLHAMLSLMLGVITSNVVNLSGIVLSAVAPKASIENHSMMNVMLSVIMLSVIQASGIMLCVLRLVSLC